MTVFLWTEMHKLPRHSVTRGGIRVGALFYGVVVTMFNGLAKFPILVTFRLSVFYKQRIISSSLHGGTSVDGLSLIYTLVPNIGVRRVHAYIRKYVEPLKITFLMSTLPVQAMFIVELPNPSGTSGEPPNPSGTHPPTDFAPTKSLQQPTQRKGIRI
ncbi:ABC transporter G family member 35, partial [Mucuna pruriens]